MTTPPPTSDRYVQLDRGQEVPAVPIVAWSTADKVMLVAGTFLPFAVGWYAVVRRIDEGAAELPYMSRELTPLVTGFLGVQALVMVVLLVGGALLRNRPERDSAWLGHVLCQFFGAGLAFLYAMTGAFTSPYLVFLVGVPLVGLVLFGKRAVLPGLATFGVLGVPVIALQVAGVLPYAPFMVGSPVEAQVLDPMWAIGVGFPSAFLAVMSIAIYAVVLERLRMRESQLEALAQTDPLTGLPNRRRAFHVIEGALTPAGGPPEALALFDIDRFKSINDRFGHPVGDRVLRIAAEELQRALLGYGFVARIGGEEFVALVRTSRTQDVVDRVHGVRMASQDAVRRRLTEEGLPDVALSWSVGLTELREDDSLEDALLRADNALLRAKEERNCLVTDLHGRPAERWLAPARDGEGAKTSVSGPPPTGPVPRAPDVPTEDSAPHLLHGPTGAHG